ncbi:hypothetical protein GCM10007989_10340 [Devosia pacifica]|uniref:Uncharacterized protein n=1 Tax=Devosia pacifica TaxID=1335967 RepID=A0A918RZM0_9HYPH|nr:hypothetical protein [Devosia pacifica]GHA17069.1 hypothetical protein GCM10007989_10340 [Devosia pacifica]
MGILIQIAIVLLAIGAVLTGFQSKARNRQWDSLMRRRVDAYIDTIRRERDNPELSAMGDSELRDLLHSGALNMRAARQRRGMVITAGGAITLIAASFAGSEQGWTAFALVVALGALAVYGLNTYLARKARAPLERYGIDVERLRIE